MIIAFYIVAGIAAVAFLGAGLMKLARAKPALQTAGMAWVEDFTGGTVKIIGVAEVLGAIGLILPMITGMAPILSPIAGICLAIIMIGASVVHVRRKESPTAPIVLAILAAAAAVLGFLVIL